MPCLHPRIEMHHGALFIFSKLANKSDSRSFSSCALKSHSSPYQMCIYEKKNMIEITPIPPEKEGGQAALFPASFFDPLAGQDSSSVRQGSIFHFVAIAVAELM